MADPVGIGPGSGRDAAGRVVALMLDGFRSQAVEHVPGTLDGDAEELHQFRVAIRRARGVLGAAKDVVPADRRRRLSRELKQMASLTSPVRDLDVLIEDLPGLVPASGPQGAAAADALVAMARELREEPWSELEAALRGDELRTLLASWSAAAEVYPIGGDPPGSRAGRPARQVTDRWVRKAFRSARRVGRAAAESDDLEHWHDLRKSLKKLRYELDAVAPFHPKSAVKPVRKQLRRLQDVIGALQDIRVREELLVEMVRRLDERSDPAAAVARSILDGLDDDLARAQTACLGAWAEFDTEETAAAVAALTSG